MPIVPIMSTDSDGHVTENQPLPQPAAVGCEVPPPDPQETDAPARLSRSPLAESRPQRGHATKDKNGKWQPTGDYEVGFGRPPFAHRFNGKAGPGRPKRATSHDAILRQQLEQKRKVRVDGKEKTMTVLELLLATTIKNALQGKDKPLRELRAEGARLYPDRFDNEVDAPGSVTIAEPLSNTDEATLAEFRKIVIEGLKDVPGGDEAS